MSGPEVKYADPRSELVPLLPPDARVVLDVGCGGGEFGRSLRTARPGLVLWGVEPDAPSAAAAGERYDKVVHGSFPEVVPRIGERFDCVFFNDVLEHMVQPADALAAARGLLTPAGCLVASIPNVRYLGVVKPLVVEGEWRYQTYGVLDETHVRFFTRKSMLRLFEASGYDVVGIEGINWLPGWSRPWQWASRLLRPLASDFCWQQYAVVARPA